MCLYRRLQLRKSLKSDKIICVLIAALLVSTFTKRFIKMKHFYARNSVLLHLGLSILLLKYSNCQPGGEKGSDFEKPVLTPPTQDSESLKELPNAASENSISPQHSTINTESPKNLKEDQTVPVHNSVNEHTKNMELAMSFG